MTPRLLKYLCDPVDGSDLTLVDPAYDQDGNIAAGTLRSAAGREYPIVRGVPRFEGSPDKTETVHSFGDQWNYFDYAQFKNNWLNDTVRQTFGSPEVFAGKVVVDAGAGAGAQSRWMAEYGADHVIALELSHSVDGVMRRNVEGLPNIDVVQCSIDAPPIKPGSIPGIVICHNVIQHTPSVEKTATSLWRLVGPGGELVFNCYRRNDYTLLRKIRFYFHLAVRRFISRRSFRFRLAYARAVALLRFVPGLGTVLEKANLVTRGRPTGRRPTLWESYLGTVLNTFDDFGSHEYQHYKPDDEIRRLIATLQPDASKIENVDRYFARPDFPGCALRIRR